MYWDPPAGGVLPKREEGVESGPERKKPEIPGKKKELKSTWTGKACCDSGESQVHIKPSHRGGTGIEAHTPGEMRPTENSDLKVWKKTT